MRTRYLPPDTLGGTSVRTHARKIHTQHPKSTITNTRSDTYLVLYTVFSSTILPWATATGGEACVVSDLTWSPHLPPPPPPPPPPPTLNPMVISHQSRSLIQVAYTKSPLIVHSPILPYLLQFTYIHIRITDHHPHYTILSPFSTIVIPFSFSFYPPTFDVRRAVVRSF